jgi:hypothetical protein
MATHARYCLTPPTFAERFWRDVRLGSGCWLWLGARTSAGYGHLVRDGANVLAHRVAWELRVGPLEATAVLCHSCDTPLCVRPDHLFVGTPADNHADMVAKGRAKVGEQLPHARLTAEVVRLIRRMPRRTWPDLARALGVSHACVIDAGTGRRWTHIDEEVVAA